MAPGGFALDTRSTICVLVGQFSAVLQFLGPGVESKNSLGASKP